MDIRVKHGDDWVLLGRVFHILFEEISKSVISADDILSRASFLLRNEIHDEKLLSRLNAVIQEDFSNLDRSGYLREIMFPRENTFAEHPFILQKEHTVYRGRIDRIIIRDSIVQIYDYKTFPVAERELPKLTDHYCFQMDIYKTAATKLFAMQTRGYLLFTHQPMLVEI